MNIMWKVLHSRRTLVLWVKWSVLQWTVCGRYWTAGGQWYCGLNGVCYSEQYVEVSSQQVDSSIVGWMECVTEEQYVESTEQQVDRGIVGWMECVTVNSMWKVLKRRWTVILWVEWSVLQWTVWGRYRRAGGQLYCGLNGVCYSEHYVEGTAQQVHSSIVVGMECVTVNSMRKVLHSSWTVVLWVEWSVLKWTVCGSYCTAGGQ